MGFILTCDKCYKEIEIGQTRLRTKRHERVYCPFCRHQMDVNASSPNVRSKWDKKPFVDEEIKKWRKS